MDSALRPREIQTRIRAGRTLDEVAQEAGVPVEKIEAFAVPVLAERAHMAGVALSSSVRRHGESHGHRTLQQITTEQLIARGVDPESVEWDAWRNPDRRWTLRAVYEADEDLHEALFLFDGSARFSVSTNDDARRMLGEVVPGSRSEDSDQLAIMRIVSDRDDKPAALPMPATEDDDEAELSRVIPLGQRQTWAAPEPVHADAADEPTSAATPEEIADEVEAELDTDDAFPEEIADEVEAELDADDVFPEGHSELDALYDMLGGINEDSINIYAGLEHPVVDDAPGADPLHPDPDPAEDPSTIEVEAVEVDFTEIEVAETQVVEADASDEQPAEREQLSHIEESEPSEDEPKPASKRPSRRRKARASVPSWDEIMFGGPPPKK